MKKSIITIILSLVFSFTLQAKSNTEKIGDILQLELPISGALMSIYPYHDYEGLWDLTKAYGSTLLITYALKYTVNETRPNGGENSFPSGHTASAFSGASYIQKRYGWKLGAPSYLMASYVGYSRVYAKKHYTHDVIAGAAIAVGATYYFVDAPFTLSPEINKKSIGITFNYSF